MSMLPEHVKETIERWAAGQGWTSKCVSKLLEGDPEHVLQGLVTQNGDKPIPWKNGMWDVWGIDLATCREFCSRAKFGMQFDFQKFSAGSTNYLLPWLGLTAQLPYETGSPLGNFLSFSMALGSPMLITFSLMTTVLNADWITRRFRTILDRQELESVDEPLKHLYKEYQESAEAALYLLREAQQVPIRVRQTKGQFSSLVVLQKNATWWSKIRERLAATRRPVTFSLVAQALFAVIAWTLTIAASYGASLGDPVQALLLSSGTLWVWLVPVVSGWVFVGTQSAADTIKVALKADNAFQAPQHNDDTKPYRIAYQTGLQARSGLNLPLHRNPTFVGGEPDFDQQPQHSQWCGSDIRGHERRQGPIFNYARIFTWWQLATTVSNAFAATLENVKENHIIDEQEVANQPLPDSNAEQPVKHAEQIQELTDFQNGDAHPNDRSLIVARYCGLDGPESAKAYPEWHDIGSNWWKRLVAAIFMAIALQWGTTGAAIVIAYLTEVRGLGCRSFTYVLYGVFGTSAFISLLTSAFLSHQAMLMYQRQVNEHGDPGDRSPAHSWFCGAAVLTRVFGQWLAVFNALLIIITSIWELVGFYDSCWCTGSVLHLGEEAWVVLFKTSVQLREFAEGPWAGGIAMSSLICVISACVFWIYSKPAGPL